MAKRYYLINGDTYMRYIAQKVLTFYSDAEVYILMAIARKKNNINITKKNQCVFREVIEQGELEQKYLKLKYLIENYKSADIKPSDFNLYLSVNPRDKYKAYRLLKEQMAHWDYRKLTEKDITDIGRIDSKWISCLQKPKSRARKQFFIIDIDTTDEIKVARIEQQLRDELPDSIWKKRHRYRTRNGFHYLVIPFDIKLFSGHPDVEIHRDECVQVGWVKAIDNWRKANG